VVAADPQLDVVPGGGTLLAGRDRRVAHATFVEGLERVRREDLLVQVLGHELPFDVVAGAPKHRLGGLPRPRGVHRRPPSHSLRRRSPAGLRKLLEGGSPQQRKGPLQKLVKELRVGAHRVEPT
jgi:hypothetical protein